MKVNKQIFKTVGVTEEDYRKWCKEKKKAIHKPENRTEFFERVLDGRLVKDSYGNLVSKRRTKNKE